MHEFQCGWTQCNFYWNNYKVQNEFTEYWINIIFTERNYNDFECGIYIYIQCNFYWKKKIIYKTHTVLNDHNFYWTILYRILNVVDPSVISTERITIYKTHTVGLPNKHNFYWMKLYTILNVVDPSVVSIERIANYKTNMDRMSI